MKNYIVRFFNLLLLLVSLTGFSQYKTLLNQNFQNNKNKWLIQKEGDLITSIHKGEYTISYTSDGMAGCVTALKKLSSNDDYIISAKIKQISGAVNQGFGIILGQKDMNNFYAFAIARQGLASIYEFRKGEYHLIENWKPINNPPNGLGEWNDFSIHKKGGEWIFLINGNVVHKTVARVFYGDGIGVLMNTSMELMVDSVVVSHKKYESPKVDLKTIAEQPILYSSDFSLENHPNLVSTKATTMTLRQGKLILENRVKEKPAFFETEVTNFSKDVAVKVNLAQLSGSATSGYGLLLGDPNKGGGYGFLISPQKKVYFYGKYNKSLITLRKWALEPSVKGMPDANEVWFVQKNGTWFFYINDKLVFETFARKIPSKEIRVVLNSNMKIALDELKVYGTKQREVNGMVLSHKKQKLSDNINTVYDEIAPIVSVDGKALYFFRNNHPQNIGEEAKQDAWLSLLENEKWAVSTNFGSPINNKNDNFIISVAPDKNTMLVTGQYKNNGASVSDGVSITRFEEGKWTLPKAITINSWYNYSLYNGFQLASDNKTLLISAERSDSRGGADLYYSQIINDSTWSAPKSLGNNINTAGNEYTPFLASDGKTLYFASSGHPGYGSLDIFMSKKLGGWTEWSKPINLGEQVNSDEWDAYLTVPASGDKMYFTSYVEDGIDADIYSIDIAEKEIRPDPVLVVSGKVFNSVDSSFVGATLSIRDLDTDQELAIAHSNNTNGEYTIVLPANKNYAFFAEEKGYYAVRQSLKLDSLSEYQEVSQDLLLTPFVVGEKILLNNIFFIRGMAQLTKNSYSELQALINILEENKSMRIEIGGHTDNVGKADLNVKLSEDRAKSIKKYLVSKGIDVKRLKTKGYGGSVPIADNKYEYTRKLNRRVEFMILID